MTDLAAAGGRALVPIRRLVPATAEKRATWLWRGLTWPAAQDYSSSTGVRTLTIVTQFPFRLNFTDVM